MPTKRDRMTKQANHILDVFMAIFPDAPATSCDLTAPELIYVLVETGRVDPNHYLCTIGSDDDAYVFEPDDDNDTNHYAAIRFPGLPADDEVPADDDSMETDEVFIIYRNR